MARTAARALRDWSSARPSANALVGHLAACGPDDPVWMAAVGAIGEVAAAGGGPDVLAGRLGLESGVSGYVHHTVPVVVHAWHRHHGDFRATVESVIALGGDTDTTAAIAGALAGAVTGESGIPPDWIAGVRDWPRGIPLLRRLGDRLTVLAAGEASPGPAPYPAAGVIPRNLLFLAVVLAHGLRRLLPPY